MREYITSWTVGNATITSVVEDETWGIPPEFFFPEATAAAVARHAWLIPDFAQPDGTIALRVQALVIDAGARRILVDPCVGNGKRRMLPFWHEQQWSWLERFASAGFEPESIDLVVHTHLHPDHVGWDTHLVGDTWVPTFTRARHLYTERELAHWRAPEQRNGEDVYADSIEPILDAGLADLVAEDADLGDGLRLAPTPGHTPGHVSLWLGSAGATAVVTGDLMHHPVQCAEPHWNEIGDSDGDQALATRRAFLAEAARTKALVIGTHFPRRSAGRVRVDGVAYRFVPVD